VTANPLRGELTITLEGVEYPLRPSYTAITAFEEKTGKSLQELAISADGGALSLAQMAVIVVETMTAFGRANDRKDLVGWKVEHVRELLFNAGLMIVQPRIALLLAMALTGGHNPGEATATGETTTMTTESTPVAE